VKKNILAFVMFSSVLGFGSAEASYVTVNDATNNTTLVKALSLNSYFDKSFDANIERIRANGTFANISETFFHASAVATNGTVGSRDWYSFNTSQANVQAYFDIDFTSNLNSWIKVYNSAGKQIFTNNNRKAIDTGTTAPIGSTTSTDSYLSKVLVDPGLYIVSVGMDLNGVQSTLNPGQGYTLHISLASAPAIAAPVPVPAAAWLFGSGFAGLLGFRRMKKVAVA
jgi:hypothetical protein